MKFGDQPRDIQAEAKMEGAASIMTH